jgi:hypothetical protein
MNWQSYLSLGSVAVLLAATLYQRNPDRCCWDVVTYKWEVHNLEIEIISLVLKFRTLIRIICIWIETCLNHFPNLFHSRLVTWFVTRLTRRVPLVEQELPTLPELDNIVVYIWILHKNYTWTKRGNSIINCRQEKIEDTKGVIRIRLLKNRQHNGQKKKYKGTNNDLQNIYIKLKIE